MEEEGEEAIVESRIAPPALSCPKCASLLPSDLGVLTCSICSSQVKVEHPVTRRNWKDEKIGCPECSKVLIVGIDKRPAHLQCASCSTHFTVAKNVPRTEVACPGCDRHLRMKIKPGEREIDCPACSTSFKVKF
jgi:DNA-directed RNA polymerase subunit RPC12/RpoP